MMETLPIINIMTLPRFINPGPVVMFFTADWCPDCAAIKPAMPFLEKEFPKLKFWAVDVDTHREIVKALNVFGVPSLVVFDSGREIGRLVNRKKKSFQELEQFLRNLPLSAVK